MIEPYYQDSSVKIYHSDARELLPLLAFTDTFITDAPYGIDGGRGGDARDYNKGTYRSTLWQDDENYIRDVIVPIVAALVADTKRGAVTPGIRCLSFYPRPADIGCFWTPAACTHGPWGMTTFQPILYYGKDYRAGKGALPTGRQVTEAAEKNGHPCPKPYSAWRWLLNKVTQPGETVIDPLMGSGTTLVAAKDLGLKAIGIEIEERYCEIAARRMSQEVLAFG